MHLHVPFRAQSFGLLRCFGGNGGVTQRRRRAASSSGKTHPHAVPRVLAHGLQQPHRRPPLHPARPAPRTNHAAPNPAPLRRYEGAAATGGGGQAPLPDIGPCGAGREGSRRRRERVRQVHCGGVVEPHRQERDTACPSCQMQDRQSAEPPRPHFQDSTSATLR